MASNSHWSKQRKKSKFYVSSGKNLKIWWDWTWTYEIRKSHWIWLFLTDGPWMANWVKGVCLYEVQVVWLAQRFANVFSLGLSVSAWSCLRRRRHCGTSMSSALIHWFHLDDRKGKLSSLNSYEKQMPNKVADGRWQHLQTTSSLLSRSVSVPAASGTPSRIRMT